MAVYICNDVSQGKGIRKTGTHHFQKARDKFFVQSKNFTVWKMILEILDDFFFANFAQSNSKISQNAITAP